MGVNKVEDTMRALLIPFVNKNCICTCSEVAQFAGLDRTAIKKYLEFYVDLMILIKYKIKERDYYTINRKYVDLYKDSDILEDLQKTKEVRK